MEITVYDGATTIGGNKIYVGDERGVFLDFGMNFARYGEFFEEFLTERSGRGIHDLVYLGLIPKLRIYRRDLIPSDLDVSSYPEIKVDAVLLTHAHLDHCGSVGLLDQNIAVVASPLTLAILKALRDVSQTKLGLEVAYFSPRKPVNDDWCRGRYLTSPRGGCYHSRKFVCTAPPSDGFADFISSRCGSKRIASEGVEQLSGFELPFEVEAFEVDHSIYGANAYVLHCDVDVAYTGDFRLHGRNADKTKKFVRKAKGSHVLIIEGTRTEREDVNESESEVFRNCLEAVENAKGLVIADFSSRNFERLETFVEISKKTGRELVITAKEAYMLHAMECADGNCRMDDHIRIYNELKERSRCKWETEIVMERWEEKYVDPEEISGNQEQFILCFSFYDLKHLLDIKPAGGSYIYSSSEAFTEEQEFDFLRLHNWLKYFGFRIYGFNMVFEGERPKPKFVRGYHASGHASKSDLRWVMEQVDPDVIIPVHTENARWFKENFENVRVLRDGEFIKI